MENRLLQGAENAPIKYLWENKEGIEEHGLTLDEKPLGHSAWAC